MNLPEVALPVPIERIPDELKRVRSHIFALQSEIDMCCVLLDAIRHSCPHTSANRGTDYSGEPWSKCAHCGKEW